MQEYAKVFYKSKAWRQTARTYMTSQSYVCERCGAMGEICHHRKYITPLRINDPDITLSFDNLECLCRDCHGKEHMLKGSRTYFDADGNVERVKDSAAILDHKRALKEIDRLMETLKAGN